MTKKLIFVQGSFHVIQRAVHAMLHVVTEQQGVLNKPTSFQMQNCALVINFKLPGYFLGPEI